MKKNYTAPEFEVELFETVVMGVEDGSGPIFGPNPGTPPLD